jgi:hypothetical protein
MFSIARNLTSGIVKDTDLNNPCSHARDFENIIREMGEKHKLALSSIHTTAWIKRYKKEYQTLYRTCSLVILEQPFYCDRLIESIAEQNERVGVQLLSTLLIVYETFESVHNICVPLKITHSLLDCALSAETASLLIRLWQIVFQRNINIDVTLLRLIEVTFVNWIEKTVLWVPTTIKCTIIRSLQQMLVGMPIEKAVLIRVYKIINRELRNMLYSDIDIEYSFVLLSFVTNIDHLPATLYYRASLLSLELIGVMKTNTTLPSDDYINLSNAIRSLLERCATTRNLVLPVTSARLRKSLRTITQNRSYSDDRKSHYRDSRSLSRAIAKLSRLSDDKLPRVLVKIKKYIDVNHNSIDQPLCIDIIRNIVRCMLSTGSIATEFETTTSRLCCDILLCMDHSLLQRVSDKDKVSLLFSLAVRSRWASLEKESFCTAGLKCSQLLLVYMNQINDWTEDNRLTFLKYLISSLLNISMSLMNIALRDDISTYTTVLCLLGTFLNAITNTTLYESYESLTSESISPPNIHTRYSNPISIPENEWNSLCTSLMNLCIHMHESYLTDQGHQLLERVHLLSVASIAYIANMYPDSAITISTRVDDTNIPFIPSVLSSMLFERGDGLAQYAEDVLRLLADQKRPRVRNEMEHLVMIFSPAIKLCSTISVPLEKALISPAMAKELLSKENDASEAVNRLVQVLNYERIWYGTRARFAKYLSRRSTQELPHMFKNSL